MESEVEGEQVPDRPFGPGKSFGFHSEDNRKLRKFEARARWNPAAVWRVGYRGMAPTRVIRELTLSYDPVMGRCQSLNVIEPDDARGARGPRCQGKGREARSCSSTEKRRKRAK